MPTRLQFQQPKPIMRPKVPSTRAVRLETLSSLTITRTGAPLDTFPRNNDLRKRKSKQQDDVTRNHGFTQTYRDDQLQFKETSEITSEESENDRESVGDVSASSEIGMSYDDDDSSNVDRDFGSDVDSDGQELDTDQENEDEDNHVDSDNYNSMQDSFGETCSSQEDHVFTEKNAEIPAAEQEGQYTEQQSARKKNRAWQSNFPKQEVVSIAGSKRKNQGKKRMQKRTSSQRTNKDSLESGASASKYPKIEFEDTELHPSQIDNYTVPSVRADNEKITPKILQEHARQRAEARLSAERAQILKDISIQSLSQPFSRLQDGLDEYKRSLIKLDTEDLVAMDLAISQLLKHDKNISASCAIDRHQLEFFPMLIRSYYKQLNMVSMFLKIANVHLPKMFQFFL